MKLKCIFSSGLFAALPLFFQVAQARAADAGSPVGSLIERIAPGHGGDFAVETIPAPPGENIFEVEARGGKIVLRGDGPLSQAAALNWYLKHCALADVSWCADDAVNAPDTLPPPAGKIRRTTRIKDRFFLNYCTFGYTMPFWRWRARCPKLIKLSIKANFRA